MKTVLTIAGSDCSGGAGIQADIKTITVHKLYAMSAVTALTAQNTTGVYGVMPVEAAFLEQQLDCIFSDIMPDAVKIGMVPEAKLIRVITRKLAEYHAHHVVLDPVMVSTSGSRLLDESAQDALCEFLLPCAELITPNLPEAEALAGNRIETADGMETAAQSLSLQYGCAVLVKGGHYKTGADDVLCEAGNTRWFCGERVNNPNTHGTGCTLSSAIACRLAEGLSLKQSIEQAKRYLYHALCARLDLGQGRGPLDHCFAVDKMEF